MSRSLYKERTCIRKSIRPSTQGALFETANAPVRRVKILVRKRCTKIQNFAGRVRAILEAFEPGEEIVGPSCGKTRVGGFVAHFIQRRAKI